MHLRSRRLKKHRQKRRLCQRSQLHHPLKSFSYPNRNRVLQMIRRVCQRYMLFRACWAPR